MFTDISQWPFLYNKISYIFKITRKTDIQKPSGVPPFYHYDQS
jgi:hypothetical protein